MAMSLDELVRDHGVELNRLAYLLTGDRGYGEDLVQEVLFALHRRFPDQIGVDDPLAYARRALVNANISRLRRKRLRVVLTEWGPDVVSLQGPESESPDDDLWDALAELPPRQRAVLVLRYYVGDSDRDIADLLGCRESSVRSLATRAFAALRPVLRPPTVPTRVTQ